MEGMIVTSAMVNAFSPFMLLNCIPNIFKLYIIAINPAAKPRKTLAGLFI